MTFLHLPDVPRDAPAELRAGVIAWRHDRRLVVATSGAVRTLAAEAVLDHHALSVDGRYLIAREVGGRRATVWDAATGDRVLALESESRQPHTLRASLGELAGEPIVFVYDHGRKDLVLRSLVDGGERGWWSTSGYTGFRVESVTAIEPGWVGTLGHRDGEQYDTMVVTRATTHAVVLQNGLAEPGHAQVWGYKVAVGPAGAGQVVLYRNPEWEPDDEPEGPDETLVGFAIYDLASATVLQRLTHEQPVANAVALGADADRIVVAVPQGVRVIDRATAASRELPAIALDPYRLQIARLIEGQVEIVAI